MLKVSLCAVALLFVAGCSEDAVVELSNALPGDSREDQVEQKLEALREDSGGLTSFLTAMPKGADLHSHLSGAVSTESLIEWGAADGICVDSMTFAASSPPCAAGAVPLSGAMSDLELYSNVLNAWSIEGFDGPLLARHSHFFDAFGKFGAVFSADRIDDSIAEVMATASAHHQIYVELISGLSSPTAGTIAASYILDGDAWDEAYLLQKRAEIMADPAFKQAISDSQADLPAWLSGARQILGCSGGSGKPGCDVDVRFIVSANRTRDRGYVFAQWVYAYELAQVAPEVVGLNLVSPEENASSLEYYDDEMFALDVLRRNNEEDTTRKRVHISLHAGELIQEVLPATAEGQKHLTFHIRRAVEVAHAERIGHAVDIAMESDGDGTLDLLNDMRIAGVMVEICLGSNNALLGTFGLRHPLKTYLAQDVPVALATDDQGILRSSITDEYVRAVTVQNMNYRKLKLMVRTSLEHSFLSGSSLWAAPDNFLTWVSDCEFDKPLAKEDEYSQACKAFLDANERARMQWKLEGQIETFETEQAGISP